MTPRELLDRLWRLGVGVDDGSALAAARAAADDPAVALELDLFAGWMAVAGGGALAPVDPAALPAGSARVLARAIDLRAARNRRDVTAIDAGFGAVDQELGLLDAADPRGPTARAAVDLALAEVALMGRDLTAARRCLGRVAAGGAPAFRIAALGRLVTLLLGRADLPTAFTRARQAVNLAEQLERPAQGREAQLLLGLVAFLNGDSATTRASLAGLAGGDAVAPAMLLAGFEPERALAMLGDSVQRAAQRGDLIGYTICTLVGGRCYARIGRRGDALLTASTARAQLLDVAPELVAAIDDEIDGWRRDWGDQGFQAAERDARAALERS